jgi:succinate dehydrogenase (ubiquinone) flavoprotein subunit
LWTGQAQAELPKNAGEKTIAWLDKLRYANGDLPTADIRNKMQRLMQNNAAVFRSQETLEEGGRLFCFEVSNLLLRFVWKFRGSLCM